MKEKIIKIIRILVNILVFCTALYSLVMVFGRLWEYFGPNMVEHDYYSLFIILVPGLFGLIIPFEKISLGKKIFTLFFIVINFFLYSFIIKIFSGGSFCPDPEILQFLCFVLLTIFYILILFKENNKVRNKLLILFSLLVIINMFFLRKQEVSKVGYYSSISVPCIESPGVVCNYPEIKPKLKICEFVFLEKRMIWVNY